MNDLELLRKINLHITEVAKIIGVSRQVLHRALQSRKPSESPVSEPNKEGSVRDPRTNRFYLNVDRLIALWKHLMDGENKGGAEIVRQTLERRHPELFRLIAASSPILILPEMPYATAHEALSAGYFTMLATFAKHAQQLILLESKFTPDPKYAGATYSLKNETSAQKLSPFHVNLKLTPSKSQSISYAFKISFGHHHSENPHVSSMATGIPLDQLASSLNSSMQDMIKLYQSVWHATLLTR